MVLAAKGDRSVLQVTNSERGQNVTVMACCNAVGNFIPPMGIFKGQRCKPEFADGAPPGTLVQMSESGYISAELFLSWCKHFQKYRPAGKCILIVDGHASHVKSLEVLDYAKDNEITLICLPPHTTHYLQPLDRSFFKPLKVYYDQACRSFISNHPGRSIKKLQFSTLLSQAWGKAATIETHLLFQLFTLLCKLFQCTNGMIRMVEPRNFQFSGNRPSCTFNYNIDSSRKLKVT